MDTDDEKIDKKNRNDSKRKSLLCIVPLPPPITGAAIASECVTNYLNKNHNNITIPYQRGNLISGKFSLRQSMKVFAIGIRLGLMRKNFDIVYLVISSTFWGNLRDLFFFFMMGDSLRHKTVIHLHGSNIDSYLRSTTRLIKYLNRIFLADVKYAIVLGETFINIFDGYISRDRIGIVKNYYSPFLLIAEEDIVNKFNKPERINILFLSNLIKEKGYEILLHAYLNLPESIRNKAVLHFAGEFYSTRQKSKFLNTIRDKANIIYHGAVTGEKKKKLLMNSHIFCLPTIYKFEGQPITLLEAYASGCIALVTNNGGIKDVFTDKINGFYIDIDIDIDTLVDKLREKLKMLITKIDEYKNIAIYNNKEASEKYSESTFCKRVGHIVLDKNICGI